MIRPARDTRKPGYAGWPALADALIVQHRVLHRSMELDAELVRRARAGEACALRELEARALGVALAALLTIRDGEAEETQVRAVASRGLERALDFLLVD